MTLLTPFPSPCFLSSPTPTIPSNPAMSPLSPSFLRFVGTTLFCSPSSPILSARLGPLSQVTTFIIPTPACQTPTPTNPIYPTILHPGHLLTLQLTNSQLNSDGLKLEIGGSGDCGMIRCINIWGRTKGIKAYPAMMWVVHGGRRRVR